MSLFGRLDVILLALLLTNVFVVVIYAYCGYNLARPGRGIASVHAETLAAVLNIELGGLKSIALTAPCLRACWILRSMCLKNRERWLSLIFPTARNGGQAACVRRYAGPG